MPSSNIAAVALAILPAVLGADVDDDASVGITLCASTGSCRYDKRAWLVNWATTVPPGTCKSLSRAAIGGVVDEL